MRRASLRLFMIVALAVSTVSATFVFAVPPPQKSKSQEYFTDEEIDYIRDAQGLSLRVSAILKLANIRLVTLGMKEKSKEDKELEKRIAELHDEIIGKPPAKPATKPADKPKSPPEEISRPYLTDFSRVELLRGYIEALDEVSGDIDDAYRGKLEVRGPLEQFEKFLSSAVSLLRRFQSRNAGELAAIDAARTATQEALESAEDGLKKIPKTEKSSKP